MFIAPSNAQNGVIQFIITGTIHGNPSYPSKKQILTVRVIPEIILPLETEEVDVDEIEEEAEDETDTDTEEILAFLENIFWEPPQFVKDEGKIQIPPEPFISEITKTGFCVVNFTKPMMIPPRWKNLTLEREAGVYNETIHWYLALRVESDAEFDPQLRALEIVKFNLTKFTPQGLVLKIDFANPGYITSDILSPDFLEIEFIETSNFIDAQDFMFVENETVVTYEMPQQMNEVSAAEMEALDAAVS